MTSLRTLATSLLLTAALTTAAFADDELPSVTEAFQYAITDTGDALEIDWAIAECCYLYRNKLEFLSGDDALVFARIELPEGLPHEDEFFGQQQVYRDRFFVSIPYTAKGERPPTATLVIKSQGCNDIIGICYPPQTWTENVELRDVSTGTPRLSLETLGGSLSPESEFPPADEVFFPDVFPVDGNKVDIGFRIVPGFYLYKDKISVRSLSENAAAGRLELPKGKMKVDEYFGEMEVYFESVLAPLAIARATPDAMELQLEVNYQGCAEGGLCYMPQTRVITVALPEASSVSDLSSLSSTGVPQSEQARLAGIITSSSMWVVIGLFFLAGLGLAFTPCVLPMVPILSGIIAGEGDNVTPMRGFTLALSYVLGMALVYTGAGIIAAAAGMQLQATFNQPWILILFAGLFVVLALGMFGAYDLAMPSGIQSRLSSISGNQKSGTMIGAFVMGALSALIVTACVAPALIAALTVMAQTGDMLRSGTALFAMSLGMGAPLLLVGAAQGKLLPKAGPWMVAVRNAFGFMMLGLAIWMLSRILPGNATMLLWAVLVFMAGVFMGGLTTLTGESGVAHKLGKGFGSLAIVYGILLLLGALSGGSNPMRPLASVNIMGGGTMLAEQEHELPFRRIKTVDDLDREIAAATSRGKTAFLDFYADWCVSCKEMEAYTFSDSKVQEALSNTVWLQADVTDNDEADQALLSRFGVFGPPTIIFFDADGRRRQGYEVVGYMKAEAFVLHLEQALGDRKTVSAQVSH